MSRWRRKRLRVASSPSTRQATIWPFSAVSCRRSSTSSKYCTPINTSRTTDRKTPGCRWAGRRAAGSLCSCAPGFAADPAGFDKRSCSAPSRPPSGPPPVHGCCCQAPDWPARRSSATGPCGWQRGCRSACSWPPHRSRCGCSLPRHAALGHRQRCPSSAARTSRLCCNTQTRTVQSQTRPR